MNVLVLGAGVIGTTCAWYLAKAGHQVDVLERQAGAAEGTSFANGSQVSVSYAEPWANPSAPIKLLHWLGQEDAPLLFRLRADAAQWRWALQFLAQCTPKRTRHNTRQLTHLALFSRCALGQLRAETGIQNDHLQRGILHLFEHANEWRAAQAGLELMNRLGCPIQTLDAQAVARLEPSLSRYARRLAGAAYAREDESGDAHTFSRALVHHASRLGVRFHFQHEVVDFVHQGRPITGVSVRHAGRIEHISADAYVMALGTHSAALLKRVDVAAQIYPVKGYSATVALKPGDAAPVTSLTDHASKIVISRLGQRLRIAGTAEFNGYDTSLNRARCQALLTRTQQLLPDCVNTKDVTFWAGLRPATPSNLPYIGRTRHANLWVNTGHGTLGWTLAAGSGQALARLMNQEPPGVEFAFCSAL